MSIFVYVDESGDLGFSEGATKVFVVGYLACGEPKILQREIRRIRERKLKKSRRDIPEFKFYKASDKVKDAVFSRLQELDLSCGYIVVKKEKIFDKLRDKKNTMYNYFVRQLIDDAVMFCNTEKELNVVLDRPHSNKNLEEAMNDYLRYMTSKKTDATIKIEHQNSCDCAGLQFVDFVAGAVRTYYERGDDTYFNRIKFTTKKELYF